MLDIELLVGRGLEVLLQQFAQYVAGKYDLYIYFSTLPLARWR
jgi:hypothetical protein